MDIELEQKIYKNYRLMMKKRNKMKGNAGFPSYWRQAARKVTAERFNVSYAEVKRIVAKYDAINGLTHEKTKSAFCPFNNPQDRFPAQAYSDRFVRGQLVK